MSNAILFHAFGARNYRHLRTEFRGGAVYLYMAKRPDKRPCSAHGGWASTRSATAGGTGT